MLEEINAESFSQHLKETFTIRSSEDPEDALEAELAEVVAMGAEKPGKAGRKQAFSVLLRTSSEVVLEQRIYRVEHPHMGKLDLFLVPVGPDKEGGMCYEAVFY